MFKRKKEERSLALDRAVLLSEFSSESRYGEAYRTLRTNLFFASMEKELHSLVITSSVEKEGKTTTAVNLALTIAQSNKKVLLIDADLRRPQLSKLFSLQKKMGLSEIISDKMGVVLTKGDMETYSVKDLIQLLKLQKRTGELNLKNSSDAIALYFVKGKLVDVYWKTRPDSKKLANTLINDHLLSRPEALLALGHQKKSVQRLGTILHNMGLVAEKDLIKALSVHTIEAIRVSVEMAAGSYSFVSSTEDEVPASDFQKVDFENLYSEFLEQSSRFQYIDGIIQSAIHKTETENLFVLPSGKIPPNPSELIGSGRAHFIIKQLEKKFDFLIFDTPPVLAASDAMLVAPQVDGTVLVIRSGHAERKVLTDVVAMYESANLPILGAVLNRVDMQKDGYYRYYNQYYSSYHDE